MLIKNGDDIVSQRRRSCIEKTKQDRKCLKMYACSVLVNEGLQNFQTARETERKEKRYKKRRRYQSKTYFWMYSSRTTPGIGQCKRGRENQGHAQSTVCYSYEAGFRMRMSEIISEVCFYCLQNSFLDHLRPLGRWRRRRIPIILNFSDIHFGCFIMRGMGRRREERKVEERKKTDCQGCYSLSSTTNTTYRTTKNSGENTR